MKSVLAAINRVFERLGLSSRPDHECRCGSHLPNLRRCPRCGRFNLAYRRTRTDVKEPANQQRKAA